MAWVRIDDDVPLHVKHLRAGAAASWLWVCGIAYCQRQLTDGLIPVEVVPFLGVVSPDLEDLTVRLVGVGLWEKTDDGFRVHDYLRYQDSREEVKTKLSVRSESARHAANVRWQSVRAAKEMREQCGADADAHADAMPGRYTQAQVQAQEKRESDTPKNAGSEKAPPPKGHRGHSYCGARFCVPHFLHEEFDRQLGGGQDVVDLFTWYPKVERAVGDAVIEDPLRLLRDEFKKALQARRRHGFVATQEAITSVLDTCPHEPRCTGSRACQVLRDIAAAKEEMRHERTDSPLGRQIEGATVETGRSYGVRDSDAGNVRRA